MVRNPALRDLLAGYSQFNAWELAEMRRELPRLSVQESLTQFFELCRLARTLAPDAETVFFERDEIHWIALHEKLQRLAEDSNRA